MKGNQIKMFGIRIVHGAPLTDARTDEVDGGGVLSVCRAEEGVSFGSESWICVLLLVQPAIRFNIVIAPWSVGRSSKRRRGEGRHALTTHTTHSPLCHVCGPCAVVL